MSESGKHQDKNQDKGQQAAATAPTAAATPLRPRDHVRELVEALIARQKRREEEVCRDRMRAERLFRF